MKTPLFSFAFFCFIGVSALAYGACYPNRGDFDGSPDQVRVLKHNWNSLRSIGLTRELKGEQGPAECRPDRLFQTLRRAPNTGVEQIGKNQRCLHFSDYGIGSYDSTQSSYCKHQSYFLVLHEDSPDVWRVYAASQGYDWAKNGLIAEFSKSGKQVPTTQEDAAQSRTGSNPGSNRKSLSEQRKENCAIASNTKSDRTIAECRIYYPGSPGSERNHEPGSPGGDDASAPPPTVESQIESVMKKGLGDLLKGFGR